MLIENFLSPAIMRRLGLGHEVLHGINPRLIYVQGFVLAALMLFEFAKSLLFAGV